MAKNNNEPLPTNHLSFFYLTSIGLTLGHLATAITWISNKIWLYFDSNYFRASCYNFFPNCTFFSSTNVEPIKYAVYLYAIAAVCALYFCIRQNRKCLLRFFLALLFFKIAVFTLRYNVMGNYHTMHISLILVFLAFQESSFFFRVTLCLQYFWAGLLKLNVEWLSGAALVRDPHLLPDMLHQLSLGYVVVLEIFLVWGILLKNQYLRRLTLVQLLGFHLYSFFIVGWFYPAVMFAILLPILFEDFMTAKEIDLSFPLSKAVPAVLLIIFLIILNISAKIHGGDPAKDGAIRHLSLNMLDARTICNTKLIEVMANDNVRTLNIPRLGTALRIHCDPVVYEAYLRNLCTEIRKSRVISKIYFHLETRRFTENSFTTIRELRDACNEI